MSATVDELTQKIITALAQFVKSGNNDVLNWLIELETKYGQLFSNKEIIESYWTSLSRIGPYNPTLIAKLIELTPNELHQFLTSKMSALILTKIPEVYSTLVDMIPNKEYHIPGSILKKLRETCLQVALETEPPQNFKLYETVIGSHFGSDYDDLKEIAKKILPMIKNVESDIQNVFNLLRLINTKLDSNTEQFGVEECLEISKELVKTNDMKVQPYLNFIASYFDKIWPLQQRAFLRLIENQITTEKPWYMTSMCFDLIPQFNESAKKDLFDTILEYAQSAQDPAIKERCRQTLLTIKEFTNRQKEKMHETFGENVPS